MPVYNGVTGLVVGVTVYALDAAGNKGAVVTARAVVPEDGTTGTYPTAEPTVDRCFMWDVTSGGVTYYEREDVRVAVVPDNAGIAAIRAAVVGLPGDVALTKTTLDTLGAAIGITTAGATVTAYLSTDTSRATPLRTATAALNGDWMLNVSPHATYTLVFEKNGYSETTRTVTVP